MTQRRYDNNSVLILFIFVGFLLCLFATPAFAHEETSVAGGFAAGFMHPLRGMDHLLAMVSVGLWGAYLKRPLIVVLPIVFPTVMALGAALGLADVPIPSVEIGIALSVIVLGGLVAAALPLPVWAACGIVGCFAIFHGYAHGKELPLAADPTQYSAGFVLATGFLHLFGILIGLLAVREGTARLAPRVIGALIALSGFYFLASAGMAHSA